MRASLRLGKNQRSSGRTTVDVLSAENSLVEANAIRSIQKNSGP